LVLTDQKSEAVPDQIGIGTAYRGPLHIEIDADGSRSGLSKLVAILRRIEQARTVGFKTEREKGYVDALAAMYTGYDKVDHRTRVVAYGGPGTEIP
jgi:hypothetical protein